MISTNKKAVIVIVSSPDFGTVNSIHIHRSEEFALLNLRICYVLFH